MEKEIPPWKCPAVWMVPRWREQIRDNGQTIWKQWDAKPQSYGSGSRYARWAAENGQTIGNNGTQSCCCAQYKGAKASCTPC